MAIVPHHIQQGLRHFGCRIRPGEWKRQAAGAPEILYGYGVLLNGFLVKGIVVRGMVQAFIGQGFRHPFGFQRRLGRAFPQHAGRRKRHGDAVQNIAAEE